MQLTTTLLCEFEWPSTASSTFDKKFMELNYLSLWENT